MLMGTRKPPGAVVDPMTPAGGTYSSTQTGGGATGEVQLQVNSDGTVRIRGWDDTTLGSGNWYSPTTTAVGNNYWVRFTRTAWTYTDVMFASATATTGWLALSSNRFVASAAAEDGGVYNSTATYTVEIASDSGGTTIVSTRTGYALSATAQN
jgi:hypothetical protein